MRTIVHLSDLHFGRVDHALLDPLVAAVSAACPDVIAVSGDLTQRARNSQFREARAFLDRLPTPQIVVPGNHDVPLHDVFSRFVRPLEKFRRIITKDIQPSYVDEENRRHRHRHFALADDQERAHQRAPDRARSCCV